MMDELRQSLRAIRDTAPKLNQATDAAKRVVARVEAFLNEECSLGIPAELLVESSPLEIEGIELEERTLLVYERIDSRFRIGIRTDLYGRESGFWKFTGQRHLRPWAESPRDDKLRTFVKLPELIVQLAKRADEIVGKTEVTAKTAEEVLLAFGGETQQRQTAASSQREDMART